MSVVKIVFFAIKYTVMYLLAGKTKQVYVHTNFVFYVKNTGKKHELYSWRF